METKQPQAPLARSEGLVVQELADEVLIYDLRRHRSHCLNRSAALIWRHCDGSTSATEMAQCLQEELGAPVEEAAIWLALHRLSRAHLLEARVHPTPAGDAASRRAILRRLAAVGGVALVSSIVVPGAEAASSIIVPPQCIMGTTSCCGSPNCVNDNECKCCFLNGMTGCAKDCGEACTSLPGGQCFQISNNLCGH